NNSQIPIKKNFNVNKKLRSPNIYWIHPDGMLNFDAVAKYFNDNQEKFLSELKQRGFEINKGANFEAHHHTTCAIPVLMNPFSYENYIRGAISAADNIDMLNKYVLKILRVNSELQYAFKAKNYAVNVIGLYSFYYPISAGKFWLTGINKGQILTFDVVDNNSLLETYNFDNPYTRMILEFLLNRFKLSGENYKANIDEDQRRQILLNPWNNDDKNLYFVDALYDILHGNYPEPRLTIIHDLTPHAGYDHKEDGSRTEIINQNIPQNYLGQHIWSGKVLINVIDMILEQDPDAIIIIQSDHGMHTNLEPEFKAAFPDKFNSNTAKELWNSTMSAIRVPDKFKTGEEHYALNNPLNITRYLVNNFVGANNYEYLSPNAEF
ncbi:MAG: hypothetical protein IJ667_03360, partial [Synergistaceae bacterium]|nr:hypothetical protein [Synergistaceae bacterium]